MPDGIARTTFSFQESVAILFDELQMAIRLERHSILLGLHPSRTGQEKAEKLLTHKLASIGQDAIPVRVREGHADALRLITQAPSREKAVFFVAGLAWGGGTDGRDAYRALNLYREVFVEQQLRTVFWLTEEEAFNLPRFAPDFWAFRHRVVAFASQRLSGKTALPVGALLWHNQENLESGAIEEGLAYALELLSSLPQGNESAFARLEAIYTLSFLHWRAENLTKASDALQAGLALAGQSPAGDVISRFRNGLAILAYEAGEPEEAIKICQQAVTEASQDGILLANLAVLHHALGRRREAVMTGLKAIKTDPQNPRLWSSLANIYIASGMFDDAIITLERALQLRPGMTDYHYALAYCYRATGRERDVSRQIELARQAGAPVYHDACLQALSGNAREGWERLKLVTGDVQLARSPLVHFLFGPDQG
jgi:tetratricopeptide (TPR) repeat protein